ncbi:MULTISPECIES: peptidase domain-containing ABC transporter [Photorhabdus]|uniref:Alpha-hemolysin translocation ATP-binding protein HlyB n=1 Tax=Photorhabdus kayaii TaxID=230088 RepID=A0ABX0B9L8_9GAMM|nr:MULTISPECIES: type I secretion system permease/ATPase [Photorhabdus]MCC8375873.1 type I secretion system permease/ATPase [Photorhabdus bodei]MCT8352634.1 type I secretion system permease/ATPase [Photorhabdus kayaii]MDB6369406.1 type I secretion system permease/ATPase [Photorhabdus bodei]NDL14171.1 type I secretion system permease/ATPase [Photorhabdus kayaii]NDL27687.1 type I secretion system permease/ATPase [Photorhabdus kayaii]
MNRENISADADTLSSALNCCRLLLQLAKGEAQEPQPLLPHNKLKPAIKEYGKAHDVDLALCRLKFPKMTPKLLPLAFRDKQGGFIVLARLSTDQALIQSPYAVSPEILSINELAARWSGEVIRLGEASLRFDVSWFIPAFIHHRHLLGEVLLFSLMLQLLALITPLFFQVVMDKVLVHKALSTLDVLVIVLAVVGLFEVVLRGLREYLFAHTANRIDITLGIKLFRHLLGLPLLYFKHRQVGAIITRVQELDSIRDFLTGSMLTLSVDLASTFVFFGVMAWLSPSLTCMVLAVLPLYFLLAWLSSKPLQQRIEQQFQTAALNTSFLNESVSGAETIKSLAVEPRMQRRWESQTASMVEAGFRTQTLNSFISHAVMLLQKTTGVGIIWLGANMVISLELTIGQLIAFNMMVSHINQPITKLIDLWQQFVQTRVAVDKLGDILNLPVEQEQGNIRPQQPLSGDLQIRNLVFRYQPHQAPVLQGVTLHIRSGENLGIVGPSGSGKSTLARLLQKLYAPDEGEILIDGTPLHQLDPGYLRSQIGVVLQENYLFNRSVRHNIAFKDPSASLENVMAVAKLAGAHDFILQLPLGYDTVLAEAGSSLSGGQRQRIAIARALMANPKILIFDEATSALDDESQALIQANMAEIALGRTVIIIAHRLSTVRHCDRIITLEQGLITESGNHHQLLVKGGCYARLWQMQQELRKETEPCHSRNT